MTAQNVPANLRKLAFAVGVALSLSAAATTLVTVETPPASASIRFVDQGGQVLSAAQVYLTYWGHAWTPGRSASPTSDEITRALQTVVGSYQAGLAQYRNVGSAAIRGSRVITTSDPPSRFTDKDIQAFLDAQFDAGVLPALDDQAIYVVTIPPGIYSSEGEFTGWHSYYQRNGHRVHYAWTTDSVTLDGVTQITTHELVESLTDPEGDAILGTPGTCAEPGWCEIADICSDPSTFYGVMVAPYWSNIAGHCVIPTPLAVGTPGHRLSGLAASQVGPAVAIAADGAVARFGERRGRAAKRRSSKRRAIGDLAARCDAAAHEPTLRIAPRRYPTPAVTRSHDHAPKHRRRDRSATP